MYGCYMFQACYEFLSASNEWEVKDSFKHFFLSSQTLFIVGGFCGLLGGATPGKYFVGISVLSAESVELIDIDDRGERVRVAPGMNPGWWR